MAAMLPAETEARQKSAIAQWVGSAYVGKEPTPLTHHLQETTLRVVILLVHSEVGIKLIDAVGKQSNLHV